MDTTLDVAHSSPRVARRARPITRIDRAAVRGLLVGLLMLVVGWLAQGLLGRRLYLVEAGGLLLLTAVLFQRAVRGSLAMTDESIAAPALPAFRLAGRLHRGTLFVAI